MIKYFHHLVLKICTMFPSPVETFRGGLKTRSDRLRPTRASVLTFVGAEPGGVDEQQQDVVQEALQHRRLHTSTGQVLRADRRPADEQRQDLSHHNGLQNTPEEEQHLQEYFKRREIESCAPIRARYHPRQLNIATAMYIIYMLSASNTHHVRTSLKLWQKSLDFPQNVKVSRPSISLPDKNQNKNKDFYSQNPHNPIRM